jgi:hypothetical protein
MLNLNVKFLARHLTYGQNVLANFLLLFFLIYLLKKKTYILVRNDYLLTFFLKTRN